MAARETPAIHFSGSTPDPVIEGAAYGHRPARGDAHGVDDPEANTDWIKATACELGADLVGICSCDDQMLRPKGEVAGLGGSARFPWVIVMAVTMDREAFRESPSPEIQAATRAGYARMKVLASSLADALAERGHESFAAGNGEAGSVPLALVAGLGQLGRNGLLLTRSYGACVRICKVFTAMPLSSDLPSDPVGAGCCVDCDRCARACPAAGIETGAEPAGSYWKVDAERCRKVWTELETRCAACITHCPRTWSVASTCEGDVHD